jgi:hypothetical protein
MKSFEICKSHNFPFSWLLEEEEDEEEEEEEEEENFLLF